MIFSRSLIVIGALFLLSPLSNMHNLNLLEFYPTPEYSKLEKLCLETGNDMDVLNFAHRNTAEIFESTAFIFDKFLLIQELIKNLINNQEECNAYLKEDVIYLINLLEQLKQKSMLYQTHDEDKLYEYIEEVLDQSLSLLHNLLAANQESIV